MSEDTAKLVWEDPPPRKGRPMDHADLLDELKDRPGQWARWPETSQTSPNSRVSRLHSLGFEVVRRRLDGRYWMWVRWPAVEPKPLTIREARQGTAVRRSEELR